MGIYKLSMVCGCMLSKGIGRNGWMSASPEIWQLYMLSTGSVVSGGHANIPIVMCPKIRCTQHHWGKYCPGSTTVACILAVLEHNCIVTWQAAFHGIGLYGWTAAVFSNMVKGCSPRCMVRPYRRSVCMPLCMCGNGAHRVRAEGYAQLAYMQAFSLISAWHNMVVLGVGVDHSHASSITWCVQPSQLRACWHPSTLCHVYASIRQSSIAWHALALLADGQMLPLHAPSGRWCL